MDIRKRNNFNYSLFQLRSGPVPNVSGSTLGGVLYSRRELRDRGRGAVTDSHLIEKLRFLTSRSLGAQLPISIENSVEESIDVKASRALEAPRCILYSCRTSRALGAPMVPPLISIGKCIEKSINSIRCSLSLHLGALSRSFLCDYQIPAKVIPRTFGILEACSRMARIAKYKYFYV